MTTTRRPESEQEDKGVKSISVKAAHAEDNDAIQGLREQVAQIRAVIQKPQGKTLANDRWGTDHVGKENNVTLQRGTHNTCWKMDKYNHSKYSVINSNEIHKALYKLAEPFLKCLRWLILTVIDFRGGDMMWGGSWKPTCLPKTTNPEENQSSQWKKIISQLQNHHITIMTPYMTQSLIKWSYHCGRGVETTVLIDILQQIQTSYSFPRGIVMSRGDGRISIPYKVYIEANLLIPDLLWYNEGLLFWSFWKLYMGREYLLKIILWSSTIWYQSWL